LFWLASRAKSGRLDRFGKRTAVCRLSSFSPRHWRFRSALILTVFVFSLLALIRPQWGQEKKIIERKGVDVIFLLDTSTSMLAQDVKPSRFEKAKIEIKSFVKKMKGDRVGLIPFSGSSFLQSPLTLDYSAFLLFLDAVSVGYIPDPGSALGNALANALRSFPKDEKKYRSIVIYSDGEFHGEDLSDAIKKAQAEEAHIYCVGTGTKDGEPIPLRAEKGKVVGYKKDRAGQVILTRLDSESLSRIARETGGIYLPATPGEKEIDIIYRDMQKLGKKELKGALMTEREEHYQLFLLVATLLLFLCAAANDRASEKGASA
jgi:Ca-activated chloride channel family protein